jgi:hypothetical protein
MTAIRRRIRAVTFAWLLCQVASLSAFVPDQCCASHAAEAAAKEKAAACHEAPAPEPKDGDACPMHHGSKAHDCCKISNACDGPGTHLTTLFAYVGVLESRASSSVTLESTAVPAPTSVPLRYRLATPDAPPPKH